MTGIAFGSSELTLAIVVVGAAIDAQCGVIPNWLTYPAIFVLTACGACEGHVLRTVVGVAAVTLPLAFLHIITRGRGLGQGDIKLAACIGAGLGYSAGLLALEMAFIIGGVAAAVLLGTRRSVLGSYLPFGPFLALGTLVTTVLGLSVHP